MTGKKIKTEEIFRKPDKIPNKSSEVSNQNFPIIADWIATVTLEYADSKKYESQQRLDTLSTTINKIRTRMPEDSQGLVLFPGGWIDSGEQKPDQILDSIERTVSNILQDTNIEVCLGIDGGLDIDNYSADQIGVVINQEGIVAAGRKYHSSKDEKDHVNFCDNYLDGEGGYPRIFNLNGKRGFITVCYDSFGIRHKCLKNPDVDFVVNLVHCFYPRGEGPSGEPYFARHGFAGASKQWKCPVFGTAVFYHRGMPERWPTGVMWNCGDMSTAKWKYENNPIDWKDQFSFENEEGNVIVRVFEG